MRTPEEIYESTKQKLSDDNCQSLNVMVLEAIEEAKREWYDEMYHLAHDTNEHEVLLFLEKYEDIFNAL